MALISRYVALVLAIIYIIAMAYCVVIVWNSEVCVDRHKFSAVIFTGMVGLALFAFRVFRGVRTRIIKYVHMVIHLIGLCFFIWGLIYAIGGVEDNPTHAVPSYIVTAIVAIQFILGFLFFTYLYENQRLRLYFAPLHDIIGLWIFICLVGCCITGYRKPKLLTVLDNELTYLCLMIGCALIVVFVVLCPFFEWDLVGKL